MGHYVSMHATYYYVQRRIEKYRKKGEKYDSTFLMKSVFLNVGGVYNTKKLWDMLGSLY